MEPSSNPVPKHIGVILDGNRRFAKRLMLKPWKGHEWGAQKVRSLLEWCRDAGIREVTLYCFSVQNFSRPKEEFEYLMDLFRTEFDKLKEDDLPEREGIRINIIGRLWMFPKDIQERLHAIMERTRNNTKYIVNFAMAYGGREEVIDATRKIAEQIQSGKLSIAEINEETFSKNLYWPDEPDLIIRTGGERRTSNFLIWQGNYAEWFFVEKCWPDFEKADFEQVLQEYQQRERRFGQ
ncbi:di-trans,poly-cis-decaprenylcistransferase [Candidatus Woesearchaeota archaeon]|nr:di-trans,poly-cis-decaprenylcistransferase [Candidatus Woesearchaeota archaeon]